MDVRVYSQEMLVASMAIGSDIFDHDGQHVEFVDNHPALERFHYGPDEDHDGEVTYPDLTDFGPDVRQRKLLVNFDTGEWQPSGVLSEMGYRVGKNGLSDTVRRTILAEVLAVDLVPQSPAASAYVAEWGSPYSRQRLQKMVNSIAAFARNARRRDADYSEAIADWESDLEYLRLTYGSY